MTQLTQRQSPQTADLPTCTNNSGETNTNTNTNQEYAYAQDLRSCSTTTTTKEPSQSIYQRARACQFLSCVLLFLLMCVASFRGNQSLSLSATIRNSESVVFVERSDDQNGAAVADSDTRIRVPPPPRVVPALSSSRYSYDTACLIAKTLTNKTPPILSQSYGVGLKFDATQHAMTILCHLHRQQQHQQQHQPVAVQQQQQSLPTPTPTTNHTRGAGAGGGVVVLTFKVARTGSTYFTDVINKAIQSTVTHQRVTTIWEPFCSTTCYHKQSRAREEEYFKNMTTSFCQPSGGQNQNRTSPVRSAPGVMCILTVKQKINAAPRIHRVRWGALLADLPSTVDVKVFNLRRSNLVKQAYSKYHHGRCDVGKVQHKNQKDGEVCGKKDFTMACLLACATHFGLGNMEFASSVTSRPPVRHAQTSAFGGDEDVLYDKKLASERLFNFLGMAKAADTLDAVFDETEVQQEHGEDLCGYQDIDCPALEKSLREGGYRCLLKQLRSDNTVTWTVPQRKGDRGIDIQGDCEVLPPLTSRHPDRHLLELYVS
eukprot:CAMPEP_0171042284 /NCGR_PEP_ID=MMETSP0736-20130129/46206_1 /TAXON_ID=186038 /ORGANISM="Fragilariopsis kerguelensis, Strain L26-C5" /LENGTH=541 /DNA_ID=CAMNT_0011490821 /DNA_START=15 /DNA_END=1642 /DNA_ORIENTATION=+